MEPKSAGAQSATAAQSAKPIPGWYGEVFTKLRQGDTELFCYVPDAGIDPLIRYAQEDPKVRPVVLTTEEEGVGVCVGAALCGKRAVLMMQSSGVGNCINAFTILTTCRVPFLLLVSMRGEFGEAIPWQVPMGKITGSCLELSGFTVHRAERANEVADIVDGAMKMAWRSDERSAVLLTQRLIGAKEI
jgi:sulfopyruvate decarboxylase alpha subunit